LWTHLSVFSDLKKAALHICLFLEALHVADLRRSNYRLAVLVATLTQKG
jgi:hypothetical protein